MHPYITVSKDRQYPGAILSQSGIYVQPKTDTNGLVPINLSPILDRVHPDQVLYPLGTCLCHFLHSFRTEKHPVAGYRTRYQHTVSVNTNQWGAWGVGTLTLDLSTHSETNHCGCKYGIGWKDRGDVTNPRTERVVC